ncbi:MAG: radical SAM protein [Candidatus Nanoarchaeia archaeon]|nr:radical SAM protein [Candidatus Nanoarchaeia archaeon]
MNLKNLRKDPKSLFYLFLEAYSVRFKPKKVPMLPTILQIEPTINCNLRCKMCDQPIWNRKARDMEFENFKKILDQFPNARKLNLQGMGEPLLNKDIFKMIRYSRSKKIFTWIITNGMLLNENNIENLLNSKPNQIFISLDAADKKVYESIRTGSSYEKVIENIKNLAERAEHTQIIINSTLTTDNFNQIPKLLELLQTLNIKKINIQGIHTWGKKQWDYMKEKTLKSKYSEIKKELEDYKQKAKSLNIDLSYSMIEPTKNNCNWLWNSCYITVDGFITPCCIHGSDPRKFSFGNLLKTNIKKIWNNKAYQSLRTHLKSENPPAFCIGCPELKNSC